MELYTLITGICETNTYIVIDGSGVAFAVDPGSDAQRIFDFVRSKNAILKYILITHMHFDHIGAVAELREYGAKTIVPRIDFDLSDINTEFGSYAEVKPFVADMLISDDSELNFGEHKIKVLATPGHTPGSVCYILDDKIIFSGDTLFQSSVGRTDFSYGDSILLRQSLKKLFALPHNFVIYPGHGQATTLDAEKNGNPYVY